MNSLETPETILIIDYGSQVTQLIARRLRETHIYCEIHSYEKITDSFLQKQKFQGIILSGGPCSVLEAQSPDLPEAVLNCDLPIFAICYGQQLLAKTFGGEIEAGATREFGKAHITIHQDSVLLENIWEIHKSYAVWMSHGDRIKTLPPCFDILASSPHSPYAFIAHKTKPLFGVQFHPEVVHTPQGKLLLENFAKKICHCQGNWQMQSFKTAAIDCIRQQVQNKHVLCALSGGVDSSVTAALLSQAIGNQLTCVFVDHGFLRLGEKKLIEDLFQHQLQSQFKINFRSIDAQDIFLNALQGILDPETKRKIIGKLFIDIFEKEAQTLPNVDFLAQGTLYPDIIESVVLVGAETKTIKSHHNTGGLPQNMRLTLIEPLRDLFKDEVRILGKELGLPKEIIQRHPFPGPGLAIRIPGQEITREKIHLLQKVDFVYLRELKHHDLYHRIWQAFAILLPVHTVGVMGDARSYDFAVALRAVTSIDGMTADYYPFSHEFLSHVSSCITNEVKGINRVTYDITSKPPGTIEWE